MTQPGASCWGQSLFGWDRGRKEGDGDVLLDHVVVHYHAVDIHINGGGGQGAGEVLEEGEGGESGGGRKHCHRVAEKEGGMWLFVAPKCVKSQNQLPFHTIKSFYCRRVYPGVPVFSIMIIFKIIYSSILMFFFKKFLFSPVIPVFPGAASNVDRSPSLASPHSPLLGHFY